MKKRAGIFIIFRTYLHGGAILWLFFGLSCSETTYEPLKPPKVIEVSTVPGGLILNTTDSVLAKRFDWAVQQALAYVHSGDDPVGKWYEAALPNREAFCMRDVSHQSVGAHYLGLQEHTKNMLYKFAENISESRDWCSYWEINKYDQPAPVDYESDEAFWYNLPANFDVLIACWKQYLLTGDRDYLEDSVFVNFYDRTMNDYIETWQLGPDSVMHRDRYLNLLPPLDTANSFHYSRGLPSYGEASPLKLYLGSDLLCLQFQAYKTYGTLQKLRGLESEKEAVYATAKQLSDLFNKQWWDTTEQNYYSSKLMDGSYQSNPSRYVLQSGIYQSQKQHKRSLEHLLTRKSINIESQSYLPRLFYQEDENERAYEEIMDMTADNKNRREYPEVSYAVVEALLEGIMGVNSDAVTHSVMTFPRMTAATVHIGFENIPIFDGMVNVTHFGAYKTMFENRTSLPINWKATFPSGRSIVTIKGVELQARIGVTATGKEICQIEYSVEPGEKITAKVLL